MTVLTGYYNIYLKGTRKIFLSTYISAGFHMLSISLMSKLFPITAEDVIVL